MPLTPEDIANIQQSTLPHLGKAEWVPTQLDKTYYCAYEKLQKKETTYKTGKSLQFNLATPLSSTGVTYHGLYEKLTLDQEDNLENGSLPWIREHWGVMYDIDEELMNAGDAEIYNLIKVKHENSKVGVVKEREEKFWGRPATSSLNTKIPQGVKMYIVRTTGDTTGSFISTAPTNHTTIAGINPANTEFAQWRNYAVNYSTVNATDFVRSMRRAVRATAFKNPFAMGGKYNVSASDHESLGEMYGLYTNEAVIELLEELLESRNESLGDDLSPYARKVRALGRLVEYVPYLDDDADNPCYGINWSTFHWCYLKGKKQKKIFHGINPSQPTVIQTHYDSTFNLLCDDRRRNFVLSTGNTDI